MKRLLALFFVLFISCGLCMPAMTEQSKKADQGFEEKFAFEKTSYSVLVGKTINLKIKTEEKGKATFSYKSADKSVATVSSNGTVKGVSKGTTTITCQVTHNKTKYSIQTTITVSIPVKSIKLSNKTLNIAVGTEYNIIAAISPNTASKKVKWTSSDKKIATVSSDGVVKGLKKGTCRIICTATDGSNVKAQITLNVKKYDVLIDSPKGKKVNFDTMPGSWQSRIQIGRYVIQNKTEIKISFKNNNVKGADDNYLLPLKVGEDVVTVTEIENGKTSRKTYTVYVSPASFSSDGKIKKSTSELSNESDKTNNDTSSFKYVLLEDGSAKITKYSGKETRLSIPSSLDKHQVTVIGNSSFASCTRVCF